MKTFQELREKSVSQSQQKMMGMALAYKRGEMDDASPEVKKMADSMSMKDLEDFAKTKHKGLPKKVAEGAMSDFHLMVKEKVPAEKIAKELGLDLKTVKKLMKDMKESVELDEVSIATARKVRNARMHQSVDAHQKGDYDKSRKLDKKVVKTMKHIRTKMSNGMKEAKDSYPLYHKTYSGAMQAAYAYAKKKGFEVDKDDIDSKVASGPRKPSNGKTNSFTLKLVGQKNKMLAVQVTNLDNQRYELNTYIT